MWADGKERCGQQQREQEEQVICTFRDVPDAEAEHTIEPAIPEQQRSRRKRDLRLTTRLHILQLIKGLHLIAFLRHDANGFVARNKAIDQIRGDAALVVVFQDERAVLAAARQSGRELDLNFTNAFLHFRNAWESKRKYVRLQMVSVNAERKIAKNT